MANRFRIQTKGAADEKKTLEYVNNLFCSFIDETKDYLKNVQCFFKINRKGVSKYYVFADVTDENKMIIEIGLTKLFDELELISDEIKYQQENKKLVICASMW